MAVNESFDILKEYGKKFSPITNDKIPESETHEGLLAKMKESIDEGYDLLPAYYGWTKVYENYYTKEFETANNLYKEHFSNEDLRTYNIYGTIQELTDVMNESVKQNKNLLRDYYGWDKLGESMRIQNEFGRQFGEVVRLYREYFDERIMIGKAGKTWKDIVDICNEKLAEKKGLITDAQWQELDDKVREMSRLIEEHHKLELPGR